MRCTRVSREGLFRDGRDLIPLSVWLPRATSMKTDKHPWFRSRGYLHFDFPVNQKKAEEILSLPENVAMHSFFPFIDYEVESMKIKKNESTGKIDKKIKKRPIAYAAHVDSHIYSFYAWKLSQLYEDQLKVRGIDRSVLAFRSLGKSNVDFAHQAFQDISLIGECATIALDITGFFDNIDHRLLKSQWCKLLQTKSLPEDHYAVFSSLTKYAKVSRDALYEEFGISEQNPKAGRRRICTPQEFRTRVRDKGLIRVHDKACGIPQGSPISALLSNIYMLDFDSAIAKRIAGVDRKYYRYCDDMLLIVSKFEVGDVIGEVNAEIEKLKITINANKTQVSKFDYHNSKLVADKPLQYLGFLFDGARTMLRSSALARYSDRMRRGVRHAKQARDKFNVLRAGKGLAPRKLYRRKLYEKYSHLGRRNFVTYALRAARIMGSKTMRKQIRSLWIRLQQEIEK